MVNNHLQSVCSLTPMSIILTEYLHLVTWAVGVQLWLKKVAFKGFARIG